MTNPDPVDRCRPKTALVVVRSLYRFLVDDERMVADPGADVATPHVPASLPKALTEDEVSRILDAVVGDEPVARAHRGLDHARLHIDQAELGPAEEPQRAVAGYVAPGQAQMAVVATPAHERAAEVEAVVAAAPRDEHDAFELHTAASVWERFAPLELAAPGAAAIALLEEDVGPT